MFSILVNHVINFKVDHQEMSLICPSRFPLVFMENLTRFVPFVQTCPFVRALLGGESL